MTCRRECFWRGFGRLTEIRYPCGHFGIVSIQLNYKEHWSKHGSTRLVSDGKVILTFTHEWLAILFQADRRVQLASVEMMKPPSHVRAKRGLDYGCPRCDEDVWQPMDPPITNASVFKPGWIEVGERC